MKNKKIILLTVIVIAVMVIMIVGMSKLVEMNWRSEKETINILNDNSTVKYEITSLGDFKFTTWDDYQSENPGTAYYANGNPERYSGEMPLSYEEAAALGGTALERINKFEDFRNMNFVLYPSVQNIYDKDFNVIGSTPVYLAYYSEKDIDKAKNSKSFQYTINTDTKKVSYIRWSIITDEQILQIDDPLEYAKTIAYDLGYNNFKSYYVESGEYRGNGMAYRVDLLLSDTESISIGFNSYNDTFLMRMNHTGSDYHSNLMKKGIPF
ncbi:MAG: hypothetical protein IKK99_03125 [Oscillospiraceae bacterium]|nr:hypothetical protein [Oscillospiraceae bacterium]